MAFQAPALRVATWLILIEISKWGKSHHVQTDRPAPTGQAIANPASNTRAINSITEKIVRTIRPRQIILFGSYAREEATASSDVDLFIIQDGQTSNRDARRQIERLLWGRRFGLDLIVRTPQK